MIAEPQERQDGHRRRRPLRRTGPGVLGISLYKGFPFIRDFPLQAISFDKGFIMKRLATNTKT